MRYFIEYNKINDKYTFIEIRMDNASMCDTENTNVVELNESQLLSIISLLEERINSFYGVSMRGTAMPHFASMKNHNLEINYNNELERIFLEVYMKPGNIVNVDQVSESKPKMTSCMNDLLKLI